MYIEKIFSEIDTDRLFSVLIDEDEYALYCDFLDERERLYSMKMLKRSAEKFGLPKVVKLSKLTNLKKLRIAAAPAMPKTTVTATPRGASLGIVKPASEVRQAASESQLKAAGGWLSRLKNKAKSVGESVSDFFGPKRAGAEINTRSMLHGPSSAHLRTSGFNGKSGRFMQQGHYETPTIRRASDITDLDDIRLFSYLEEPNWNLLN